MDFEPTPMDVDENIFNADYKKLIEVLKKYFKLKSEDIFKFLNIIIKCKQTNVLYINEYEIDLILTYQQKEELTQLYNVPLYYPSKSFPQVNIYSNMEKDI
jgi:hypothetical protein